MTQQPNPATPVFVDPSGRRHRWVRFACWVLGLLFALYVAVVVLSLFLPPGALRLRVPGLGPVLSGPEAPGLPDAHGRPQRPVAVLPVPTGLQTTPPGTVGTGSPGNGVVGAAPTPPPGRSSSPTPSGRPGPTGGPKGTPSPTPAPSPMGTSSPTAHPTPKSTNAHSPTPHPSRR